MPRLPPDLADQPVLRGSEQIGLAIQYAAVRPAQQTGHHVLGRVLGVAGPGIALGPRAHQLAVMGEPGFQAAGGTGHEGDCGKGTKAAILTMILN
ncbi:hypothetical protein G6F61_014964 [Rhizopus arrhizus]|nr:hypothetical protein G6F31_020109 [Rhizopus arrhizus]KAG1336539.1 hypothetical protein G6F61_014964 [Rhizopus arrhizus]